MNEEKTEVLEPLPTPSPGITSSLAMPKREYFDWRKFDPTIHLTEGDPMAEELATYGEKLNELLPYEGEYVLIKGREICGVFPTARAALDEAVVRFGDEPAMVRRISTFEAIEVLGHILF